MAERNKVEENKNVKNVENVKNVKNVKSVEDFQKIYSLLFTQTWNAIEILERLGANSRDIEVKTEIKKAKEVLKKAHLDCVEILIKQ